MRRIYIKPDIKTKAIDGEMLMSGSGVTSTGEPTGSTGQTRSQGEGTAKENTQFNLSSTEIQSSIWDD